jgi:hypothetical protein
MEYVERLYERIKSNTKVFRNIMADYASSDRAESDFFRKASLERIFEKYVTVNGSHTRIGDFGVGPFLSDRINAEIFPGIKTVQLKEDESIILIESSRYSFLKIYRVNKNSFVEAKLSLHYP